MAQTRPVTVEGTALSALPDNGGADPAIGAKAPTLVGQDFAGKKPSRSATTARRRRVVFVAHWCPHCQREIPRIAEYLKSTGLPSGVELYFVPDPTNSAYPNYPPSKWLQSARAWSNVPTLVDDKNNKAHAAYGGGGFPYFVLVDQGRHGRRRASPARLGEGAYPTDARRAREGRSRSRALTAGAASDATPTTAG